MSLIWQFSSIAVSCRICSIADTSGSLVALAQVLYPFCHHLNFLTCSVSVSYWRTPVLMLGAHQGDCVIADITENILCLGQQSQHYVFFPQQEI